MSYPNASVVRELVAAACRAPSVHNTQPWHWTWQQGTLRLCADQTRHLRHTDPKARDLTLSCGAALRTLQVAAGAQGWTAIISRTASHEATDDLASITFAPHVPTAADLQLAAAILDRHTDRRHTSSWPIPGEQIDVMRESARALGVIATPMADEFTVHRLTALLAEADRIQGQDPRYLMELGQWTRTQAADGIPATSLPDRVASETFAAANRFPAGNLDDPSADEATDVDSWLLLSTSSDDPLSWLRAGEALAAIWIDATSLGISAVPYSQVIEVDQTRRSVQQDLLDDTSCPQMLLRLGWPTMDREAIMPTSRRPVDEVLTIHL